MATNQWKVVAINPHPDDTLATENEVLSSIGVQLQRVTVQNDAELIAAAADADVVAPMGWNLSGEVIRKLDRCRHIPSGGIGFDHIDAGAATEQGILVTNMAET